MSSFLLNFITIYYFGCLIFFGAAFSLSWNTLKEDSKYEELTSNPLLAALVIILICWVLPLAVIFNKEEE